MSKPSRGTVKSIKTKSRRSSSKEAACVPLPIDGRSEITRIVILTSAASEHTAALTEVHSTARWASPQKQVCAAVLPGIGEIEFTLSDDEEERNNSRPGHESVDGHGNRDRAETLESFVDKSTKPQVALASLPPEASSHIANDVRLTKRCEQACARFRKMLEPLDTAIAASLIVTEPVLSTPGTAVEPPLFTVLEGLSAVGSGVGHPIIRIIQRLIKANRSCEESTNSTLGAILELSIQEFFRQCFSSNGTTSMNSVIELVRICFGRLAPSLSVGVSLEQTRKTTAPPFLRELEAGFLIGGCDTSVNTFCDRETWLQALHPSLLAMRNIFGATRADSPDVHLHFLEVGIVDKSDTFAMPQSRDSYKRARRPPALARSRSPPDRGQAIANGSTLGSRHGQGQWNSPLEPSSPLSPRSFENIDENIDDLSRTMISANASEEQLGTSSIERLTAAGERRLQFWDGFFSYRSLGAVSRELASNQLIREKDLEEDDVVARNTRKHLMYHLSPNHGVKESTSSMTLSAFSSSMFNTSMFETSVIAPPSSSTPRTPKAAPLPLDILFPSLEERRKYAHLKTLRRPPGATAEPPDRDRPCLQGSNTCADKGDASIPPADARPPQKGERELPPIVAAAKSALAMSPRSQGREVAAVSQLASPELPIMVKDPLLSPMFMNVANAQKEVGLDMAFVTNAVGFEMQPLTVVKARRAANNATKSRVADKGKTDERTRGISKRWSSSTLASVLPTEKRCNYCIHHNIQPSSDNSAMTAKWEQKAGIRQRTCAIPGAGFSASSIHLCVACGDDLDTPFTPRVPKLLFDAAQGTPLEAAPSNILARIRTPGLATSRHQHQRTGRASITEIQKSAAAEQAVDIANAQPSSNGPTIQESVGPDEVGVQTSPKRQTSNAGFAYELPKRVLSENVDINKIAVGNVYFVACEKNHARPLPAGPGALAESGALVDASTNQLRLYRDPRSSQGNQGEDVCVALRGADLDDNGLAAFIDSLTQKGADFEGVGIHIDIARNRLTDSGISRFLGSLEDPLGWVRRLETLDVAQNRLLTASAIEPLYSLLVAEKLPRLRTLRLGGIELTESFTLRLFKGIDVASSGNLVELDISFLGLGRSGPAAPAAAAALIRQCQALCTLDVSGNHLNTDAICALGHALSEVSYMQTLHFAHNTGNWPVLVGSVPDKQEDFLQARQSDSLSQSKQKQNKKQPKPARPQPFAPQPCTAMCGLWSYLSKIPALRVLDLRDAQVDPRCAFMLSCAVFEHKNLEAILLNGNPLGVYGVRALLAKAFLAEAPSDVSQTHLSVLSLDHCDEGSMLALDVPSMSLADPSGSYIFDLRDPWSCAALEDCLNQWKKQTQLSFDQAFPFIEVDGKPIKEIAHAADGTWELPRSGVISFTCLLPCNKQPCGGAQSFRIRPQDYHRRTLSPELEQRALRIAATCQSLVSLQVLVQALAADFWLRGVVVKTLCQWMSTMGSAGTIAQIAAAEMLSDCVIDAECDMELLEMLCAPRLNPSPSSLRKHYCVLDYVSFVNPTGHYVFNLAWPSDRVLAEDFLVMNNWEVEIAKTLFLPDRSRFGNYQYFRNEALDAKSFVYRSDWVLPTQGILEFDISVPRRWPKATKALAEESFQKLKGALAANPTPAMMKALCLRRISSQLILTSQQALSIFTSLTRGIGLSAGGKRGLPSPVEMTLLCVLIFRIKDYQNIRQAFFKNPGPFESNDRLKCCERLLGCLNIADPLHLNTELRLNLDVHEERQYCRMVLNIVFQEGGRTLDPKSFASCAYGPDTPELHPFPNGAPPDRWMKTGLPRRGVLALTCTLEEGSAKFRRRQAQLICGWEI